MSCPICETEKGCSCTLKVSDASQSIFRNAEGDVARVCTHVQTGWCPICNAESGCRAHDPECACGICKPGEGGLIKWCTGIEGCDCPGCRPDLWTMKEAMDCEGRVPHVGACGCGVCVGGHGDAPEVPEHDGSFDPCACPICCPTNYKWHSQETVDKYDIAEHLRRCVDSKCLRDCCVSKRNYVIEAEEHADACDDSKCMAKTCVDKRLAEPAKQVADLRTDAVPYMSGPDWMIRITGGRIAKAIEAEVEKRVSKRVSDAVAAETAKRMEKIRERVNEISRNMLHFQAGFDTRNSKLACICRGLVALSVEVSGDPESTTVSGSEKQNPAK